MNDRGERRVHNGSHVRITTTQDAQVLSLFGELDLSWAADLRVALSHARSNGNKRVIVDLRGLTFMDSTGLGVFLEVNRPNGGSTPVHLIPGPPGVQRVFEVSGTTDHFTWVTGESLP